MTTALLIGMAGAFLLSVGLAAYHSGRRHGRVALPASLVTELREHKLHCIGEPPERVNLEIALLCESDDRRGAVDGLSR